MIRLIRCITLIVILSLVVQIQQTTGASAQAPAPSTFLMAEPALSPDRAEIAFISGGDIWTVPAEGGQARLLVSHTAVESRPLYSPDGRNLAFISTRTGNGDIYILSFDTGQIRRLTYDDSNDQLDSFSRDGKWIYFSSTSRDIAGMNDIFRVSVEGGTPMQVSADRFANEFFSAPSPDSRALAFTARGIASSQWWRKGRSHIDESEIWVMRDPDLYERITEGGAKEMWPMWSADGSTIFYVSDRSGAQNIWSRTFGGQAKQITKFRDGRVLWPNISYDGRAIVFERNFSVWKLDTANGQAAEIRAHRRGAPSLPAVEHLRLTDRFQEFALSPDGKKIAFAVRGEIFASSARDGGDATRVTRSPASEYHIAWSPDSRRIAYVSDRDQTPHIYLYDFTANAETQVTRSARADAAPRFSPDGKLLAFERDAKQLCAIDLDSHKERTLAEGVFERPPLDSDRSFAWSPDSRWIAFTTPGAKAFKNVHVVPLTGGASQQISFIANTFSNSLTWSPDGSFILFNTAQRTEGGQVARIDLTPRLPKFREDQFRDLFKEDAPRRSSAQEGAQTREPDEKKPGTKNIEITFEGIRRRLSLIPAGVDVRSHTISPDGKWLLVSAAAEGQQNLYTYSLDELSREPAVARQLTSTPDFKAFPQFTPDSKEVFYIEQGRIHLVPLDTRASRPVAVTAEMDVDFQVEKMYVFRQAWGYLNDYFYDPNFHGVNWKAVREEYEPRIAAAQTADEMRRVLSLMVGELNASHLGVSAPFVAAQPGVGKLGLRFDRAEYEIAGKLKITEVIPLGPAEFAGIKSGEYLLAVDGASIDGRTNLDELLAFKSGRRVALTLSASADGAGRREAVARPVSTGAEKGLVYRKWVEEKRDFVSRISNGRLGYVHMPDMSANSLAQLYIDLDVENHSRQGVVIDIRNNNGGFVNAYALDVFARRGYMNMTRRGFPSAPARSTLGQRALELPTILVINQHSLSDAEDFTEGYRALKLGKVVGEPTAGWIIYTSNVTLIDGTGLRLPFIKITGADGKVMELAPRPVDVAVHRPIGESYTGRDIQLETAVRELLKNNQ
jgi:Tol biopolymer transport system component